jgi:hypothetical protein
MNTKLENSLITKIAKKFGILTEIKSITQAFKMTKQTINISVDDAIRIALVKMCPVPSGEVISLSESYKLIKPNLTKKLSQYVDENYIRKLLDKQVIRNQKKEFEETTRSKTIRYAVYKEDVDNYCLILQVNQIQDYVGLSTQTQHPETGKDIEMIYTPSQTPKKGFNRLDSYTGLRLQQLQDKNVVQILQDAIKESLAIKESVAK